MTDNSGVQFILNGETVCAAPGETVLNVAKKQGIDIPTLCHHDSVTPYGSCRLCLVEVFWGKRSKVVTSCIYTPYEGDRVETDSERVRNARRMVIEMLLARCPEVEILQELGCEYGVENVRFPVHAHDDVSERCILCGLCVRVCDEVVGQSAIGYAQRGKERVVTTPFNTQAEECIGCGACVFVCPTQALHYEDIDGQRIMKELNTSVPLLPCTSCGSYFATDKQAARAKKELNLTDEMALMCPRCRGAQFRESLERCLVLKSLP